MEMLGILDTIYRLHTYCTDFFNEIMELSNTQTWWIYTRLDGRNGECAEC